MSIPRLLIQEQSDGDAPQTLRIEDSLRHRALVTSVFVSSVRADDQHANLQRVRTLMAKQRTGQTLTDDEQAEILKGDLFHWLGHTASTQRQLSFLKKHFNMP